MSIPGAVSELNKEIARLTQIRDSLLPVEGTAKSGTQTSAAAPAPVPVKKTGRSAKKVASKKSVPAKALSVKAPAKPTKRVVSPATRKKMSDAAKARAATKKVTAAK